MAGSVFRGLAIFCCLGFLTACQPDSPEGVIKDYRERVANVLDEDTVEITPIATLTFPDKRDRTWPTQALRAGLLDSIEFRECDLLPLIVERNGSLGKVMPVSSLMGYELRFFDRLLPCHREHQSRSNQAATPFDELLQETYEVKSSNLEAVVWNGLFTSDEFSKQFSTAKPPIPLSGNPGFQDSLRALQYFQDLEALIVTYRQQGSFSLPDEWTLNEDAYFSLYASEFGSQLHSSLKLLTAELNQTAEIINQRLDRRSLCFNEKTNSTADTLLNVFNRHYAAQVQPYMAMVQQQGRPWQEGMSQLMAFGGEQRPAAMQRYHQQVYLEESPVNLWFQYQMAIKTHTKAWQRVLTQCGLMPKGN